MKKLTILLAAVLFVMGLGIAQAKEGCCKADGEGCCKAKQECPKSEGEKQCPKAEGENKCPKAEKKEGCHAEGAKAEAAAE